MTLNGQLHASATLPCGKSPWYPLTGGEVGSIVSLGSLEKKNLLPLPGINPKFLGHSAYDIVAIMVGGCLNDDFTHINLGFTN
jgi:hypothetical protein